MLAYFPWLSSISIHGVLIHFHQHFSPILLLPLFYDAYENESLIVGCVMLGTERNGVFLIFGGGGAHVHIPAPHRTAPMHSLTHSRTHALTHSCTHSRTHANRYDHQERFTAQEAMAHPYFAPVREAEQIARNDGDA